MNTNPREYNQLYQNLFYCWLQSEVQKISESFYKISQCIDTSHFLNQTLQLNSQTSKTQMVSQPCSMTKDDSNNLEKGNEESQGNMTTFKGPVEKNNISPEVVQENRLKSNQKKKIATGRICTVKCIDNSEVIKGYMVVFKYYSIKLTFGPFALLDAARDVRVDFRERLFLLRITKCNYNTIIPTFYLDFKSEMEKRYKELPIYHKINKKR